MDRSILKGRFTALQTLWRSKEGAALVIMTAGTVLVLSAAAISVDVGMMLTARAEAQRTADLSALAGASSLIALPNQVVPAQDLAISFAAANLVQKTPVVLLPGDVVVDLVASTVTATVNRTAIRGNPVGTFFARVFGVNAVDVVADATAQVVPAGGINCLLPLAIPDRWYEDPSNPANDPYDYEEEYGDYYVPWAEPGTDPLVFNDPYTGYSEDDIGLQMLLKDSGGGGGGMNPSWYFPWRPPGQSGGADYRENIRSCVDPSIEYTIGMDVDAEPGNMKGPTLQGFKDLIAQDPGAVWNDVVDCVTDAAYKFSGDAGNCRPSPRVRPVPFFDPRGEPPNGSKPFTLTNFGALFVESQTGDDTYIRFMGYAGLAPPGPGTGASLGPLFKTVVLIE